jgi:exopolyphosphatase/guanosine-5'-triphosphate,3'-diphosphate pyrophosphatase
MKRVGIVDIGSNTVRICIYELKKDGKYNLNLNEKEFVRLRNHLIDGRLSEEGIRSLLEVLKRYLFIAKDYKLDVFKLFATQTIRMAINRDEILTSIRDELDMKVDLLSGDSEALFGFKGMKTYLEHERDGLYVDLGGGSTEVVYFKEDQPIKYHSFDFGSLVLRNFLDHSVPTDDEIYLLEFYLLNEFKQVSWLKNLQVPIIVVGGSSRNMVRIDKFITKRTEETHGYRLGIREITRTRKLLMLLTIDEIEKIQGFTKQRADVIIPSIYVFELLYKFINANYYVCSRTGLREGYMLDVVGV